MSPTPPRVLVVGAGSIGTRHARNLVALGAEVHVADPDAARLRACPVGTPDAGALSRPSDFDGIVLASPTAMHAEQLLAVAAAGRPVLVEKPIAHAARELAALPPGTPVMVGYNLRFHEPVRRFVALLHDGAAGTPRGAHLWFGSHLPDWRASDYRAAYSARAALGGGVLLDAVHELDLLLWLFDERDDAAFAVAGAVVDRVGPLEIDVEDTVRAVLRHGGGAVVSLELDYLSRRYRRGVEIVGDRATLRLDWAREVIELEDRDGRRSWPASEDVAASYEREVAHFLAWLAGGAGPPVDAATGLASLRLAERIRSESGKRSET